MDIDQVKKLLNAVSFQVDPIRSFFEDVHRIADALEHLAKSSDTPFPDDSGENSQGGDILVESDGVSIDDQTDRLVKLALEMIDEYENDPGKEDVADRASRLISIVMDRPIGIDRTGLGVDVYDKETGRSLSEELADHR